MCDGTMKTAKAQDLLTALLILKRVKGPFTEEEWQECDPLLKQMSLQMHYLGLWNPAWINRDRTYENEQVMNVNEK